MKKLFPVVISLILFCNCSSEKQKQEQKREEIISRNEGIIIRVLRNLNFGSIYYGGNNEEGPRTLHHLQECGFHNLGGGLDSGEISGYYFGLIPSTGDEAIFGAVPIKKGITGNRSFLLVDRIIYAADLKTSKQQASTLWIPGKDGVPEEYWEYFLYNDRNLPFYEVTNIWQPIKTDQNNHSEKKLSFNQLLEQACDSLHSPYPNKALKQLQTMKNEGISKLLAILKDKNIKVYKRGEAARLLGHLANQTRKDEIIKELKTVLKNEKDGKDDYAAIWAANSLAKLTGEYEKYTQEIIKVNPYGLIRQVQARAIGDLGPDGKAAIATIISQMKDDLKESKNSEPSWYLINTLGQIGPSAKDALPLLIDTIQRKSRDYTKIQTMRVISKIQETPSVMIPFLIEVIKNKKKFWEVRWYAIMILGGYGKDAAIALPVLKEYENDYRLELPVTFAMRQINKDMKNSNQ